MQGEKKVLLVFKHILSIYNCKKKNKWTFNEGRFCDLF